MIPKKGTQKANTNLVAGQDLIRHPTNQTLQAWRVVRLQINLSVIEYQKKTLKNTQNTITLYPNLDKKKANDRTSNNRIRKKMIQPRVITNTLNHVQKKINQSLSTKNSQKFKYPFSKN